MHKPPFDPRRSPSPPDPTWREILAGFAQIAAVPLFLLALSRPLTVVSILAATAVTITGVRRAARLHRCFRECRQFTIDLAGRVRITVAHPPADGSA